MKRIAVTITTNLWVPEDRYMAAGSLSTLASDLHVRVAKPLQEWASMPEFAMTDTLVNVEVQE